MRITKNIEMLELKVQGLTIYPILLWDENDVVLIDAGYPGQFETIRAEITKCGLAPEQITKLILTHQDIDHTGCARLIKDLGAKVMAFEQEIPYIQGDKPLTKITDMEARLDSLAPAQKGFYQFLKDTAPQLCVQVDVELHDEETLPICGGIQVIQTPGHTPGHIALRLCESGIVICGDAANINDGVLIGAVPAQAHDLAAAEESFKKIALLNATGYVCYHSGYLTARQ
jgi:Zn-dependent hydrolases, including glyoxylases